jgi:hypothetical protein
MTPEQQRIAIAEACGWTNVAPLIVKNVKHEGDDITVGISSASGWIPDYLNDLNACHEMEKGLDYEQCEAFSTTLADIVHAANREKDYAFPWAFARIHATAAQRCEAFLLTLGLWQESNTQPVTEESSVTSAVKDSFTTAQ